MSSRPPPGVCRLEGRVNRKALAAMQGVLVEPFIQAHQSPPQRIVLGFDATDDAIHGKQEGRFFHSYYGGYCYPRGSRCTCSATSTSCLATSARCLGVS